jgi:nucleoside-diphosphate-sugar epimerase
MKLFVTGASSFVGAHFCRVASRNHQVVGQYFSTPLQLPHIQPVRIDLREELAVKQISQMDIDAIVHIACKIKGKPKGKETIAEAALRENSAIMDTVLAVQKPVVYASSTVVHWESTAPYVRSRREDEQRLSESGIPYTIIRPSAPYGPKLRVHSPKHKESFHTLIDVIRKFPFVPVIGNGQYRRQPVHVDDLSKAIIGLLEVKTLANDGFDIGGAKAYTFVEIIDVIQKQLNLNKKCVFIPKKAMAFGAKFVNNLEPSLINAIDEDEVANPRKISNYLGWEPRDFSLGVKDLLS